MTFVDDEGLSSVGEVFDELRRFHVYDHDHDKWVMSGVDFGDCVALQHVHDDPDKQQAHVFSTIETLTEENDELTVVYEDGEGAEYDEAFVDMDTAGEAAQLVIAEVAEQKGVDKSRIKVASLEAPNVVRYYLEPEPLGGGEA